MKLITTILIALGVAANAQNISLKPGAPNEATAEQKADIRESLGLETSTTGGAHKVPKFNANGDLITGPFANDGIAWGNNGNVLLPDMRGIRWLKQDGTESLAGMYMWEDHDAYGGELLISSPFRTALVSYGPIQVWPNDSARLGRLLMLSSGYASNANANLNYMPSGAVGWQTSVWNGSESVRSTVMAQSKHLDTSGTNTILEWYGNAAMGGEIPSGDIFTASRQVVTGDLWAQMTDDGFWSPGSHPEATGLSDAATVTWTANKYKSAQTATVTLQGNRTLAMSGWENGMRGVILIKQDAVGGRTLTLPDAGNAPEGFTLSTDPYATDEIEVIYTGSVFYFKKVATYPVLTDASAAAFFTRASITDAAQKEAVNNLVLDLKGAGIWSKLDAAYPFVGGNSTAHSKNLLADSRHITWSGTVTHNADGITGNGTDGRGVADFNFSDRAGGQDNAMVYVYCKTQSPNAASLVSSSGGTNSARAAIRVASASSITLDGFHLNAVAAATVSASSDFRKHFLIQRPDAANHQLWVGASKGNTAAASTGITDDDFGILCRNYGTGFDQYSNANLAFVAFGQALSDGEYTEFRAAIDRFQTALSRANP